MIITGRNVITAVLGGARASFAFAILLSSSYAPAKQTGDADSSFRIVARRTAIHILPASASIRCADTLVILKPPSMESLRLQLLPVYRVDGVMIGDEEPDYKHSMGRLEVGDLPDDSLFELSVSFSTEISFQSEYTRISEKRAVLREEEILPRGPRSYRSVRLHVTVPTEWQVFTVGNLVDTVHENDSVSFVYRSDIPVSSIGWICAGKFRTQRKYNSPFPLAVHLFDTDSSDAGAILIEAQNIVEFYGDRFSPYRFPKLDVIEIEDWVAGPNVLAIAGPSFIMIKQLAFTTDDPFNTVHSILPHEIAHQWWPGSVFVVDRDLALLSEGLCEYSAVLFNEHFGTGTQRDSLSKHPLLRPLIMRVLRERDFPLREKVDLRFNQTHYLKAAYVHHMLRETIGDSAFAELLTKFAKTFEARDAVAEDFMAIAESVSGKQLGWFFNQWVERRGIPRLKIYNVRTSRSNDGWMTKGRVRMVGYEKYTTFVDVGAFTPVDTGMTRVWMGTDSGGSYRNDVGFEIRTMGRPVRAALDPLGNVLKVQRLPVKFSDLRDPADGVMIVGTLLHHESLLQRARDDSALMSRAGWTFTITPDSEITLVNLQNDRVFLYGKANENSVASDLSGKFPYGFKGDSVFISSKPLYDSSLTFSQIVENPFVPQGLLCWIAPLSPAAKADLLPFDASWILLRGKDEIGSGTWDVRDEDVVVEVKVKE